MPKILEFTTHEFVEFMDSTGCTAVLAAPGRELPAEIEHVVFYRFHDTISSVIELDDGTPLPFFSACHNFSPVFFEYGSVIEYDAKLAERIGHRRFQGFIRDKWEDNVRARLIVIRYFNEEAEKNRKIVLPFMPGDVVKVDVPMID